MGGTTGFRCGGRRRRVLCALLVGCTLLLGTTGVASAWGAAASPEEAVCATVTRYLDSRARSFVTLEDANRDAIIADTEDTAITKAFDDVQTAVAREIGCGWADYDLSTDFRAARVTGKRAHVVVVVDTDCRYAASPEIDSGIYNVRYDVRLAQHGDDWRIVGIRSDNADHLRFEGAVALRVADGKSVREAARELKEERIAALPGLARELGSVSDAKPSEPSTAEDAGTVAATVQPMAAASYSYSASRGDEYAERFATT